MYRPALRSSSSAFRALRPANLSAGSRRLLSTAPAQKRGTWKGAGLRWALAIGAVYFYNTSPIFADEPAPQPLYGSSPYPEPDSATVEAVIEEKRRQIKAAPPPPPFPDQIEKVEKSDAAEPVAAEPVAELAMPEAGSPAALEEEADQQGAFNPETGEINWDCPCLGGMAHGPCGEEFKAAFSCFVYSKEEPKGMDCIDKFSHMQDCFRKYPEIYGSELADDAEEVDKEPRFADAGEATPKQASDEAAPKVVDAEPLAAPAKLSTPPVAPADNEKVEQAKEEALKIVEEVVPKDAHDATQANKSEESKKQ
ncbi:hypothetical protein OQA88_9144 [Cercophora sp. LCS_1]